MACAENYLDFPLATACRRLDIPLIYVIENTIGTRLKIAAVETNPLVRRAKSALWELGTKVKRRAAFRLATGLAINVVAATRAYSGHTRNVMTFFDNRMTPGMMATQQELSSKLA
jgi:colanic acid/amylovoran biosynthesis glycosyltransferase